MTTVIKDGKLQQLRDRQVDFNFASSTVLKGLLADLRWASKETHWIKIGLGRGKSQTSRKVEDLDRAIDRHIGIIKGHLSAAQTQESL